VIAAAGPLQLLTQQQLLQGLRDNGEETPVSTLNLPELPCVDEDESMEAIFERLQTLVTPLVGVTRQGRLAGVIDLENVVELINIEAAIKAHRRAESTKLM
jgi:Mg/Co/Ni transporter MgtE